MEISHFSITIFGFGRIFPFPPSVGQLCDRPIEVAAMDKWQGDEFDLKFPHCLETLDEMDSDFFLPYEGEPKTFRMFLYFFIGKANNDPYKPELCTLGELGTWTATYAGVMSNNQNEL